MTRPVVNIQTSHSPTHNRRRKLNSLLCILVFVMTTEEEVLAEEAMAEASIPDVIDYFPDVMYDLSKVTWAHAVNDKDLLKDSIDDGAIMMLEADVSAGRLVGQTATDPIIPIMAHPPYQVSNLSLKMWLEQVIEANENGKNKGAKLDFKDMEIVKESLETLKNHTDRITFPLWLNADILRGPGKDVRTPIPAEQFLALCTEYFPTATLSVGWTTVYDAGGEYTKAMVDEMVATLEASHVAQPVTFPIRAAFVANSLDALEALVDQVADSSITVWSSESDTVDVEGLVTLQESVGPDAVYFDLPPDQMKAFEEAKKAAGNSASPAGFQVLPNNASTWATAGIALASALAALYFYD